MRIDDIEEDSLFEYLNNSDDELEFTIDEESDLDDDSMIEYVEYLKYISSLNIDEIIEDCENNLD